MCTIGQLQIQAIGMIKVTEFNRVPLTTRPRHQRLISKVCLREPYPLRQRRGQHSTSFRFYSSRPRASRWMTIRRQMANDYERCRQEISAEQSEWQQRICLILIELLLLSHTNGALMLFTLDKRAD